MTAEPGTQFLASYRQCHWSTVSSAEESEDRRARVPATEAVQVECNPVTSVRVMSTYPIVEGDGARYAVVAVLTDAYLETVFVQV